MVTGSRRGEISALRWRHVDFDRGFLLVQRENAQPKSGIKEETKTGQQRRVALDPETLALLAEHRKRCEQRCADLDCALSDDAYLFSPAPDGSAPFPPRALTQKYNRLAKKPKLRSTRLHSLRHYSATPTTAQLAEQYAVSIATSHRAIALLASEGLITVSGVWAGRGPECRLGCAGSGGGLGPCWPGQDGAGRARSRVRTSVSSWWFGGRRRMSAAAWRIRRAGTRIERCRRVAIMTLTSRTPSQVAHVGVGCGGELVCSTELPRSTQDAL
ncbi:MAG: tyrosine-type recombinase/integrase [Pseudonocardiaceae bacterium]